MCLRVFSFLLLLLLFCFLFLFTRLSSLTYGAVSGGEILTIQSVLGEPLGDWNTVLYVCMAFFSRMYFTWATGGLFPSIHVIVYSMVMFVCG